MLMRDRSCFIDDLSAEIADNLDCFWVEFKYAKSLPASCAIVHV